MKQMLMLFVFALLIFMPVIAVAQQTPDDVVYLKSGSIIRGMIIEQVPNKSLKIQTKDGNVFVYKMDEVEKITKETPIGTKPISPQMTSTNPAGYKSPAAAFVLSWLVPGVGQMYNGQTGKGILQLGAVIVGYTLFIVELPREEEVWVYNGYDTYDYGYWEWQDKGNGAIAWPALALGLGVQIWSMVDAPLTASRHNKTLGHSLNEINLNDNLKLSFSPIDFRRGLVRSNATMVWKF